MSTVVVGTLLLIAVCLNAAVAKPSNEEALARRSALTVSNDYMGWWFTLRIKNGSWCGLRDFPPRGGYGTNRVYCVWPQYDNFWMWRLTKTDGSVDIRSGDQVILSSYNPAGLKLCGYRSNIICSVNSNSATRFIIEKVTGSGAIDITTDDFYLKVGDKYCGLNGRGHSQEIKCDRAAKDKSKATIFNFPASSFLNVQLVNKLTGGYCGGNFLKDGITSDGFYCGPPTYLLKVVNLTIGLLTPGAPGVLAGANVTFKTYDRQWSYQQAQTMLSGTQIKFPEDEEIGATSFFTLERVSGAATGGVLDNGTEIAIRGRAGKYCGQTTVAQDALNCDRDGPTSSLPAGYRYTYNLLVPY